MIVNSHPYNPTSQQRCVGLTSSSPQPQPDSATNMNQQNSLYGSQQVPGASHMFDLANLQQHFNQQDLAYDTSNQDQQQLSASMMMMNQQQQQQRRLQANNGQQQPSSVDTSTTTQQDVSLYSPSSSTSLLYHIYDQINLPGEHHHHHHHQLHHQQQHQNNRQDASQGKKTTTILNPANLFGGQQQQQQQQPHLAPQPPPLPPTSQMSLQQHQLNEFQKQCYGSTATHTLAGYQQQQQQSYQGDSGNLMLDVAMMRLAGTLAANSHLQNRQLQVQRPLSSSGTTSSLSARSTGQIAYGRQPRQTFKSSQLAGVLHQNSVLNHHHHHVNSLGRPAGKLPVPLMMSGNKWKRCGQRVRQVAYEYRTIVKCSSLLILLAFSLMSIIKFSLLSASSQQQQALHPSSSYGGSSNSINPPPFFTNPSTLPSTKQLDPLLPVDSSTDQELDQGSNQAKALQKSRLVIGEFVIVNQNYSRELQPLVAETIVKLLYDYQQKMDQVFLAATDLRRYYSKMEVTNISAHKPSGIIVSCNILLNESISYAAQLFGIALYESLNKSHEHLANYRYIIDKSSIKFNNKDLRSGNLPPANLIAPSVRKLFSIPLDSVTPPGETAEDMLLPSVDPIELENQREPANDNSNININSGNNNNQVIWSEWSPWSSCVDKNGFCDSSRLHSRIRKCYVQTTGQKVDASQCKMRFNSQDQEIEVTDCQRTCQQQDLGHIMSDAPQLGPQTAPPILVGPPPSPIASISTEFSPLSSNGNNNKPQTLPQQSGDSSLSQTDTYTPQAADVISSTMMPSMPVVSTQANSNDIITASPATPTLLPPTSFQQPQQPQLTCSNCTSDEICLLLIDAKVPFCAKIKDRQDESGCGGWCKGSAQLCHSAGANAFKCIHDTECLPEEWRCLDSACIPLSKRCDGHSNCYDSSDERGCPAVPPL